MASDIRTGLSVAGHDLFLRRLRAKNDADAARKTARTDRSKKRIMAHFETKVEPACVDLADNLMFDLGLIVSMDHLMPGFYPGAGDLAPLFKTLHTGGVRLSSPWPVRRNYYNHADFLALTDTLRPDHRPTSAVAEETFDDFRPLDRAYPAIEGQTELHEEEKTLFTRDDDNDRALLAQPRQPFWHNLLGVRIRATDTATHVLLLLKPNAAIAIVALESLMTEVATAPQDFNRTFLAYHIRIGRQKKADHSHISTAFCAWEMDHPVQTQLGYSSRGTGMDLYSEEDRNRIEAYHRRFLSSCFEPATLMPLLPAYFDYRVDRLLEGPAAERAAAESDGADDPAPGLGGSGAKAPRKAYKLIRAVRLSKPDDEGVGRAGAPARPDARAEPETQVPVAGFWRRLREGRIGRGPDGAPEMGRTWVREHRRWRDKPEADELPRVKEPIGPYLGASPEE